MNPLRKLEDYGQSLWLDNIRRHLLRAGTLQQLIREDGLKGVTSNPSIFKKAIAGSTDYDAALEELARERGVSPQRAYERLAVEDIQEAASILVPVHEATGRRDGFVSLEVSPDLAHDTQATCHEARRLWKAVGRDNVMIKVPATPEGIPAIETLIGEGININVTLLFSVAVYEQVVEAYLRGLEKLAAAGRSLDRVASVASFFVSRVDTAVDALIDQRAEAAGSEDERRALLALRGRAAISNAKVAYHRSSELFSGPRWQGLARRGARAQRVLWASTSTKDPAYSDVRYMEELIGTGTVTTVPPATMDAFRDHGRVRPSLEERLGEARDVLAELERLGISLPEVTDRLLEDGVRLFADAFRDLLAALRERLAGGRTPGPVLRASLPPSLQDAVDATMAEWRDDQRQRRLWARDTSLWTGQDENRWLDWLGITEDQLGHLGRFAALSAEVHSEGFTHAVLLGMGGSSLCPDVLATTFGRQEGFPELLVLDSTDPSQVRAVESRVDLGRTLFIVSSKSGSTLEPNILKDYFLARVAATVGGARAASRFVAVTDPGSSLEELARREGFRRVYHGVPGIGGRYSALSDFGMVPAAVMGLDVEDFLERAEHMVQACAACVPPDDNPGVALGVVLGELGRAGRDKVTLVVSPGIAELGAWLEQLLAESTGKEGRGLIPVDGETLGTPGVYGEDRLFVYLRLETAPDHAQDEAVAALEGAGQPVVRIAVAEAEDLGREFFRWEVATAVAGAVIGINAFNQPDVEASKVAARKLTDAYEKEGALPSEAPLAEGRGLTLFADEAHAAALLAATGGDRTLEALLRAHLRDGVHAGDYVAILAYLERNRAHTASIQGFRLAVRDATRCATCLGFGPRFLHSTGQAYKGGPNTGVFLQLTCDERDDLPVPGRGYTFGVVKAAQAIGDLQVLAERHRRALRIHLGGDVEAGLDTLGAAVRAAVGAESAKRGK